MELSWGGMLSKNRKNFGLASFHTANKIMVAVPGSDSRYLVLKRSVPFTGEELAFARMVVEKVHADKLYESNLYHLVLCDMVERAIARLLDEECADTIHRVIRTYNQWAMDGYAQKNAPRTIGIHLSTSRETGSNLFDLANETAVKSLCAPPEALLSVDKNGNILGVDQVSAKLNNYKKDREILAPGPLADIAMWTNTRHRIAIRLTPQGEILIFRNKSLAFAKRRSFWRSLPHKTLLESFMRESTSPDQRNARMAIYLTILDLAFSGTGACLGILEAGGTGPGKARAGGGMFLPPESDRIAGMLRTIIKGRKFFQVPRPLRAALCTLDGALVIDGEGEILVAGARVKTNETLATGGGRSAAARTLAERGVGVKISREGYVAIYDRNDTPVFFA